jgi:ankyrin repeat protein
METPLIKAILRRNATLAIQLIDSGADVTVADSQGMTALHYAMVFTSSLELINKLISAGADVNAADIRDETPLFMAVYDAHPFASDYIKLLAKHGANVNAMNCFSETPLTRCVKHTEIIHILVSYGATNQ